MASPRYALKRTLRPISVLVGLFVVRIATFVLELPAYALVWLAHLPSTGLVARAAGFVLAVLAEGAGGYIAARLSGPRALQAALAVGAIDAVLVLAWSLLRPSGAWEWWMMAAYAAVLVFAALAGGRLAIRRRDRVTGAAAA